MRGSNGREAEAQGPKAPDLASYFACEGHIWQADPNLQTPGVAWGGFSDTTTLRHYDTLVTLGTVGQPC